MGFEQTLRLQNILTYFFGFVDPRMWLKMKKLGKSDQRSKFGVKVKY